MVLAGKDGVALIILAGGRGERLGGREKPLLTVGGRPLIDQLIERLGPLFTETIIVANAMELYEGRPAVVVPDEVFGEGPFRGILSGLKRASAPRSFVVAGDMPFVNQELVKHMIETGSGYDVIMPSVGGGLEPLHAVYAASCTPVIERFIRKDRRVISFLPAVRVKYISEKEIREHDPELLSFFNINTPEDLKRARAAGKHS